MPEILIVSLPELPLVDIFRASARGPIGRFLLEIAARRLDLSNRVLEALLNIT